MKTPRIIRSANLRGRRGIVLIVSGALALGSASPVSVRWRGDSSAAQQHAEADGPSTRTPVDAPTVTDPSPPATPTRPSPTVEPATDPTALADGVYPTFVRAVDVQGATVTVDVLQIFVGAEQRQAAIEDGVNWQNVMYDPVYIRNENPLLRTLPVAGDARITFLGGCESPNRQAGLNQLRKEAWAARTTTSRCRSSMAASSPSIRGGRYLGLLKRTRRAAARCEVSVALTLASLSVTETYPRRTEASLTRDRSRDARLA